MCYYKLKISNMKTIKTLILFLFVMTLSCSESDDSKEEQQQAQGSLSLAFISGGGFVMENVTATISGHYDNTKKLSITITGEAEGSNIGELTLNLIDNAPDIEAFKTDTEYSFNMNSNTVYANAAYVDSNRDFSGNTGRLTITKYEESTKSVIINGILNITGNNETMLLNMSSLIVTCNDCTN